MSTENVAEKFEKMGARLKVGKLLARWRGEEVSGRFTIDVGRDRNGEFFELLVRPGETPEITVADVSRDDRHLLLHVRESGDTPSGSTLHKFLCGHDERAWFAAALPDRTAASNVAQAKEALKPKAAVTSQGRHRVKGRNRNRRKNAGFVRQGEWFFIPRPSVVIDKRLVFKKEPLVRGRGKPHVAEFLFRRGGETVYVSSAAPGGSLRRRTASSCGASPTRRSSTGK